MQATHCSSRTALTNRQNGQETWGWPLKFKEVYGLHLGHRNKQHPYYMEGKQLHVIQEERDTGVQVIMTNSLNPLPSVPKRPTQLARYLVS
jgi:hypothetical protein